MDNRENASSKKKNRTDADSSPEDDKTVSSASLLLSPRSENNSVAPLCSSTPLHSNCNGVQKLDKNSNCNESTINGSCTLIAESSNSIDVLSAGESDAGDTLKSRRRNHNSISSVLAATEREGSLEPRRRLTGDSLYLVAKELLMNERTYKRDLELVTVSWSGCVSGLVELGADVVEGLGRACLALEPLARAQASFLASVDQALQPDNGESDYKKVPDIFYDYILNTYDAYSWYIGLGGALLGRLEAVRRGNKAADAACALHDAAAALPLECLLLRPLHAARRYHRHAAELCRWSDGSPRAEAALAGAHDLSAAAAAQTQHAHAHAALCRLQRDIAGYDKLLVADREFLRLGCVYKHSAKGLQQRMLFLFTDMLLIASKSSSSGQFKAQCVLSLHELRVQPCDMPHSFTILNDDTSITLSTSNEQEMLSWCVALESATEGAVGRAPVGTELTDANIDDTLMSSSSGGAGGAGAAAGGGLAHVCWHRVTSLSMDHLHLANTTQLSGYLLRKFKKSGGWQKLWVVFALFSLYFYKSSSDQLPLVSLPLLGYTVGAPAESDGINKQFVFKLQFKNHVYFFRADSHYTYQRWTETLRTAMVHSEHTAL